MTETMKRAKYALAFVVAAILALAMAVPAWADANGSLTVENATHGKAYKAYKVFDATYSGTNVSYKVTADKKASVSTDLFDVSSNADSNGYYTVSKKNTATDDQIIEWLKSNYTSFDSTGVAGEFNSKNDTVTFSNLPYGYYYVTSTLGSAISVDTTNPSATIEDKNASAPTDPVKTIVSVDGTAKDNITEADVHVGSVVGFKITGNATNWTTSGSGSGVMSVQNTAYSFTDTFANLTINENSYVVKVNGTAIASSAFSATINGGTIEFNIPLVGNNGNVLYPAQTENSVYIPIEITYTATVTAGAADAPATNKAKDSEDKLYTYMFDVAKVDGSNQPLAGAQFELWYNNAALTFIDNGDGSYTYSATGTVTTLDMTTNTTISIKGLDKTWTYTLKETKVPDGYNQAADKTINGSSLIRADGTNQSSQYTETVINNAGTELPSTGGMGTTILYIVGGIMVVVAAVVLITKRRIRD